MNHFARAQGLLKREDAELSYEVAGSGAPVLLIQGIGVLGQCWRPQVEALAAEFQMLTFDNRGIGKSIPCNGRISIEDMAEDTRALMAEMGWESAHVIGHSMGGVIAQQLALDSPKRVRSLSLLCTFARGKDGARMTPWVLWMTLRTRIGTRQMRRHAFLEMLWSPEDLRTANIDELAARVGALVGRDLADQPAILMKQVQALGHHDTSSRLSELAGIPTLILSAEHDPIALPRYGRMIADGIPGAHFEEIKGASHAVTIERASEVNAHLGRFLRSVEKSRAAAIL